MAKWRYKLDIKDIWSKASDAKITPCETGKAIAQRIKNASWFVGGEDEKLEEIVDMFECMDPEEPWDNLDSILNELYDWGDEQVGGKDFWSEEKRCWIATEF